MPVLAFFHVSLISLAGRRGDPRRYSRRHEPGRPPQEQDKRESLEDLQRQFEELFLWPSPSSCCPPVRATRLLPSPPFPSSLFPWRPEPTRPASASPLCPRSSVSCGPARSRDLYSSDCLQFFAYSCSKIAKYKVEIVDTTLGNGF